MKTNLFLTLLAFLAVSCLDDKTNYDYTAVNEIRAIENIESDYTLYPGESVTLEPVLRYTLDSIHPDVSYEWYVDLELKSKEPVYEFVAGKIGNFYLTLVATVNSSKLSFTRRVFLKVDSEWKKGWLILSDRNRASELSLVKTKSITLKGDDGYARRDTVVIVGEDRNISPALGTGPIKLFEHFANDDYATIAHEIVVVQENKCVELNGYSLEREIYTEEEFAGTVPSDFQPVDVAMTYKGNAVLDKSGFIYHSTSSNAMGFHTGRYSPTPYQNGLKFSALAIAKGGTDDFMVAVKENEDNTRSFVGIVDRGSFKQETGDFGTSNVYNGHLATLPDDGGNISALFNNLTADILYTGWSGKDESYGDPMYLSVLKENGKYYFLNFQFGISRMNLDNGTYKYNLDPYIYEKRPAPDGVFDDFRDMALFPYRDYTIVASGAILYAINYKDDVPGKTTLKSFPAPVTTLAVRDFRDDYDEYEGPQLGVGLENGEFYIFEVDKESGQLKEVYHKDGYGKIVDVIYKYCQLGSFSGGYYY